MRRVLKSLTMRKLRRLGARVVLRLRGGEQLTSLTMRKLRRLAAKVVT
jgi:hypothetical protein